MVIDLSREPTFVALAPVSETQNKLREGEELVTRFFAYGDGLDGYHDRVSQFLFSYARKMNESLSGHPEQVEEYRKRFMDTMTCLAMAERRRIQRSNRLGRCQRYCPTQGQN